MKKKVFKNVWLRVAMIVAVVTTAFAGTTWAKDYTKTYTFGSGLSVSSECSFVVDNVTWNMVATLGAGGPSITSSSNGITFSGKNNGYWSDVSFSTSYFSDKKVKSVTMNVTLNGKVEADQADVTIGSSTGNNNVTVTGTTGNGGELEIVYTPGSHSTFYIKSITVVYEYATPTFSRGSGQFHNNFDLVLSTATPGATIYYMIDDDVLDGDGNVVADANEYTASIPVSETTTVSAVTVKNGERSDAVSETFTYTSQVLDSYTATLYVNGCKHEYTGIEQYGAIPMPEIPEFMGYEFVGWVSAEIPEGETVNNTSDLENLGISFVDVSVMGNEDITAYALYAVCNHLTATFTAAGTDSNTGIQLTAMSVGKGASNHIDILNAGQLQNVIFTLTDADKKIGKVSSGAHLHTDGTTQTITFSHHMGEVKCYATKSYGISASSVQVTAVRYSDYRTNFDVPSVTVSVTAAGWATYCGEIALDFEGTGITAYVATLNGTSLSLTPINQVPANVGVILKSESGAAIDADVPELYEAPAITVNNCLTGVIEETTLDPDDLILNVKNGKPGFYRAATNTTLRANRAYISNVYFKEGVKDFIFDEDDATAIQTIESAVEDGAIYNLAGQRLQKMQKGINIVNGKKILF